MTKLNKEISSSTRFFQSNGSILFYSLLIYICYKIFLSIVEYFSNLIPHSGTTLLGPVPWANFDGAHYLSIAQIGYVQFQQAFFPFYPYLIYLVDKTIHLGLLNSGFLISNIAFIIAIFFLVKLSRLDFQKSSTICWIVLFFLSFPTTFFTLTIYTESLFLALVFSSFLFARNGKFLIASILGGFASATRLVGLFLLPAIVYEIYINYRNNREKKTLFKAFFYCLIFIPSGLITYMIYQYIMYSDPLFFIHSQPAFGAGRSGGEIILLPQVVWRYLAIFMTVPLTNYDYWKAFFEFAVFFLVLIMIYLAYRSKIRISYVIFSFFSLLLPTFSGTLSSIPRYALVCFAIFFYLVTIKNKLVRFIMISISLATQSLLVALFLRGYFVS